MARGNFLIVFLLGFFLFSPGGRVVAQETGVSGTNLEFYRPAVDPFGYFGVNAPRLLKAGQFHFRISQGLAGPHLFQIAVNSISVDLVDWIATTDFLASVGVNDFLTVGVDVPFSFYAREADFNTLTSFTTRSLGDIRMAFKLRLLEEGARRLGIALLITNTFPTGNEGKFLGTSHMVPGVELIVGKELKYFGMAVNAGARFPQQKNVIGQNFDDQITYGAGLKVPFGFLDPLLSVIGEVRGHFEPNDIETTTTPVEFTAGLRKDFKNGLTIMAGGGGAWNNAIGNPRLRGLLSVGYSPPTVGQQKTERKEGLPEGLNQRIRTTVYFRSGQSRPIGEYVNWLSETAELIKRHSEVRTILIEGHTDSIGNRVSNLRLSLRRAEEVKEILTRQGIDPEKIEVKGLDADQPVAPNDTPSGRSLNRRVEIRPLSP